MLLTFAKIDWNLGNRQALLGEMPTSSELRAAIDAQRIAGDPAGLIGSEKNNGGANVVWLGHALERLDAQREFPSCTGLGKGEQHSKAYRAINPRRVVPTLVLEDGAAIGEVPTTRN